MVAKAEHYMAKIEYMQKNHDGDSATLLACRLLVEIMEQLDTVIDKQMMDKRAGYVDYRPGYVDYRPPRLTDADGNEL